MKHERVQAAKILILLFSKKASLSILLQTETKTPFIQEICYGVARFYFFLNDILKKLISKSLKEKDQDIKIVILMGLYELIFMKTAEHAAVSETVNIAKIFKKSWACSLINATLRRFLREKKALLNFENDEAKYSHPLWLIQKIKTDWLKLAENIFKFNNQYPPMHLRINLNKISRENYLEKIKNAQSSLLSPAGVVLDVASNVDKIPGFKEGLVSVQDAGAQLAAYLLDLKPHQRVLDACAAPGGKTLHILEVEPKLKELIAVDKDSERLKLIKDNLKRTDGSLKTIISDVTKIDVWWDGKPFDRILLDAPCSGTGVIRRHPDIKIQRCETDITKLANQQLKLLQALWLTLKPGGKLLYSTCSILSEENERVIEGFLRIVRNVEIEKLNVECAVNLNCGIQLLPSNQSDGFYYASLIKHL